MVDGGGGDDDSRIRARFIEELERSAPVTRQPARGLRIALAAVFALSGVGIPIALHLLWGARRRRPSEDVQLVLDCVDAAREFARRAEPVIAFPLMVNSALRKPGGVEGSGAPGLVIVSFDPAARDTRYMMNLAVALSDVGDLSGDVGKWSKEQRRFAAELMADEDYQPFRRRKIPVEMTRGRVVYACDLMIHPGLLHGGYLQDALPLIPCLAEPGDDGRIMVAPHWMVPDGRDGVAETTPTEAERDEFLASLIYFEAFRRNAAARAERQSK